jgi:hypothetical protein
MIYVIDLWMLSIYVDTKWHLEMLCGNMVKIITPDGDATIVICTKVTDIILDTPQYSSSSYSDTSQSFHYPRPDINMKPPTRWVYEWEDPHFYNMLLQQWQTTAAWTGQTWQDYKAELLRVQGLNVMSTAEYQMATKMGVFPFLQR